MKTLILMRHARPSKKDTSLKKHDRPLSHRGQQDALLMAALLQDKELVPQIILTSSAVSARQTSATLVEKLNLGGDVLHLDRLYKTGCSRHFEVLREVDDRHDRLLLIGHNPALRRLVGRLGAVDQPFPTASIAYLALPIAHWAELSEKTRGELVEFFTPAQLHPAE